MDIDLYGAAAILAAIFVLSYLYASKRKQKVKKSSIVRVKAVEKLDIQFLYGSQTGTAEAYAQTLADEAQMYELRAKAIDLEDFDTESLTRDDRPLTVFLMATYGEGEPTDNAVRFMEWLSEENSSDDLSGLKYTVFGLGNRQYEHFNMAAKKTDTFLTKRGAHIVYPMGMGDDDRDIEADFEEWKENLWPVLCGELGVPCTIRKEHRSRPGSKWAVVNHGETEGTVWKPRPNPSGEYDSTHPFSARVVVNKELFTSDRSCRHIEIETDAKFSYKTGDHLGVIPENRPNVIASVASRLGLNLNQLVSLSAADPKTKLPFVGKKSVADILTRSVNLTAFTTQSLMASLALIAENPA